MAFNHFSIVLLWVTFSAVMSLSDVKFYTFTENGKIQINLSQNFTISTLRMTASHQKLKILCHGWQSNIDTSWYEATAFSFISKGELNVLAIDWGFHANTIYPDAVTNVYQVGKFVGEKVLIIHVESGIPLDQIHLIGHSLGAHVSGMVGQYIFAHTGQKVGRITGLDPAGPAFDDQDKTVRLSLDDASFVDIIHTNTLVLGYKDSIGHIDFWPNGGRSQPGCGSNIACSHNIAPMLYANTIAHSCPTWQCDSIALLDAGECFDNLMIEMGPMVPSNIRGNFFLRTKAEPPYCIGVDEY